MYYINPFPNDHIDVVIVMTIESIVDVDKIDSLRLCSGP